MTAATGPGEAAKLFISFGRDDLSLGKLRSKNGVLEPARPFCFAAPKVAA